MPTFMAYYNGQKCDEFAGADPRKLQAMIERWAPHLDRFEMNAALLLESNSYYCQYTAGSD